MMTGETGSYRYVWYKDSDASSSFLICLLYETFATTYIRSYRFMAPEVFLHEEYTETVDVYSYSMIFYYMLRGIAPWHGLSGVDAATKAAVDGKRFVIPRDVDAKLATLLKRCWDEDPMARPCLRR